MEQRGLFQERCLNFGSLIWNLSEQLPKTRAGRHTADQLFRSGTSVGANVHEARAAESRADFIHKMQVSLKEAREAHSWLSLIRRKEAVDSTSADFALRECHEIICILAKSVLTARKNSGI
jgi:four helix bundle protein